MGLEGQCQGACPDAGPSVCAGQNRRGKIQRPRAFHSSLYVIEIKGENIAFGEKQEELKDE